MSELYLFERGTTKYPYTNGLDSVSFGGDTYTNEDISYDRVNITNDVFRADIGLSLPITNALVVAAMTVFTTDLTTLKIYRDSALWWAGRVVSVTINKSSADLKCESIYSSIKRLGVRSTFERLCRYTVYSTGCGVDITLHTYYNCSVTVVSGNEITIPAVSGDVARFKLGLMKKGGNYTTILKKVGDVFTVTKNIGIVATDLVDVSLGCDHSIDCCYTRFDNVLNYGGAPFIPASNIFEVGIV